MRLSVCLHDDEATSVEDSTDWIIPLKREIEQQMKVLNDRGAVQVYICGRYDDMQTANSSDDPVAIGSVSCRWSCVESVSDFLDIPSSYALPETHSTTTYWPSDPDPHHGLSILNLRELNVYF